MSLCVLWAGVVISNCDLTATVGGVVREGLGELCDMVDCADAGGDTLTGLTLIVMIGEGDDGNLLGKITSTISARCCER